MGPGPATQHATNGLVWAQHWPQACNRCSCTGPEQAEKYATDELTWAQHWPQSMQPMISHGPSPGHPACYQWSCVGPALATKHATDDLAWAQSRPKSMLPMNSHASVKVGGVPQCSGEVEHCGMLGTPAPFQSSVEWCGTAWNGCALTTPVTPCHHLSTLGTEKY